MEVGGSEAQKLTLKDWLERAVDRVPKLYEEKVPDEIKKRGKPQHPSIFDFTKRQESPMLEGI